MKFENKFMALILISKLLILKIPTTCTISAEFTALHNWYTVKVSARARLWIEMCLKFLSWGADALNILILWILIM